jgi:soluble lytic murein transglycosylase-like protein
MPQDIGSTTTSVKFGISRKIIIISIVLVFLILAISSISLFIIGSITDKFKSELVSLNQIIIQNESRMIDNFQTLSAGISFDQKRKRILIQLRDIIENENKKISHVDAYAIAKNNLEYCDKYKRIDVLLLTALQKVESNFDHLAVSKKGALGLNQIWPSTGRSLCRILSWEYNKDILLDIDKNSQLACTYLDLLLVNYNGNIEYALAEYNGGPRNAYYYKTGDPKIKTETKEYVLKVITYHNKLKKKISETL